MSFEGFYKHCLEAVKAKKTELLGKKYVRGGIIQAEVNELITTIQNSMRDGEVGESFGTEIIKELKSIDFTNLAKEREQLKKVRIIK